MRIRLADRAIGTVTDIYRSIWPAGYLRPAAERQRTIDKIEPVLSPKYFTVQHNRRRSEHSQRKRFLAIAPIDRLHLGALLRRDQCVTVEAVFIGNRLAHPR